MARFPCTTADILNAAKRFLVSAAIVSESQTFISLQPDDLLKQPPDPPIISVSFFAQDQFMDTLSCEATNETTPTIIGDLIFSIWLRLALDQDMRDDEIVTSSAYGFSPIISQLLDTFNNVQLTNEAGQEITWRSLNYVGVRNRGRWRPAPEWRRVDVRFDCTFELQPSPVPTTPFEETFTASDTWTAPANLYGGTVTIVAVGAGANGEDGGGASGIGGGGGAYATGAVSVTAGEDYTITIDSTASNFTGDDSEEVEAQAATGSTAGDAAASVGTTKFSGGDGNGSGLAGNGGGGGGAGGPSGNGSDGAENITGGASGGAPGGAGGDGGTDSDGLRDGTAGSNYGGGGGGGAFLGTGGVGAGGLIKISGSLVGE